MFEYIPVSFFVIRHVWPKLNCRHYPAVVLAWCSLLRRRDLWTVGCQDQDRAYVLTAKFADYVGLAVFCRD